MTINFHWAICLSVESILGIRDGCGLLCRPTSAKAVTRRKLSMVFNKKRDCHVIRKLEAKLDIHSFTRQKFGPISCRRYLMGKESKDHTIPRVLRRRRTHTGGKPAHQGAKGEYITTIARTDCKLLPNHLLQYHSEKFYID